jgi:hypothetical protein
MTLGFKSAPINDLPTTISVKYGIWGKIYDGEPNEVHLFVFEHTEGMEEHGFFLIQTGRVSLPIDWAGVNMDVTSLQVESLRKEITKIRGEAEAKANEIQGQINRLLSITLDTKGR